MVPTSLYEASETRRRYGPAHARERRPGRGRARARVALACVAREPKTFDILDTVLTRQPAMRGRLMSGLWCAPKVSGRLALRFGLASDTEGVESARKVACSGR